MVSTKSINVLTLTIIVALTIENTNANYEDDLRFRICMSQITSLEDINNYSTSAEVFQYVYEKFRFPLPQQIDVEVSSQEQDGNESENSSLGSQDIGDEESQVTSIEENAFDVNDGEFPHLYRKFILMNYINYILERAIEIVSEARVNNMIVYPMEWCLINVADYVDGITLYNDQSTCDEMLEHSVFDLDGPIISNFKFAYKYLMLSDEINVIQINYYKSLLRAFLNIANFSRVQSPRQYCRNNYGGAPTYIPNLNN